MNGKGGTGKTTIAALLIAHLVSKKAGSILAIDADPNSCLAEALGVKDPESIVGICEDISKNMDKIPQGITKDRYIEMKVQGALTEESGFDLLVMGRPEGPGCYCYVNNLLRDMISRITNSYDYVVIDNAAGMEHISRRTTRQMAKLVLVSDYSIPGVRSAKKIYDLAKELGISIEAAYLIINKSEGPIKALEYEIKKTGLAVIGNIPYDDELASWGISDRPIFEFKSRPIKGAIEELYEKMAKD